MAYADHTFNRNSALWDETFLTTIVYVYQGALNLVVGEIFQTQLKIDVSYDFRLAGDISAQNKTCDCLSNRV